LLQDGKCHFTSGKETNILDYGWDGSACLDFNLCYSGCQVDHPSKLGDHTCNPEEEMYNSVLYGYDDDDCANKNKKKIGRKIRSW